jgi:parallel beta-helix repeat protein
MARSAAMIFVMTTIRHLQIVAVLAATTSPLAAKTINVAAGEGAQTRLQEALIVAEPGDIVQLGAGRFVLSDGLSLDVANVTLRGAGMEASVLDFSGQQGAGEGLLVTSDGVTLRDFAVENPKGDGIKSKGADNIAYYRVRVEWTGGALSTNGAYGIYPVESTGVLVDGCKVSGASDAGIYVGQSRDISVRYNFVEHNVAGIEIENSRNALVSSNFVTRNTGGILVFDLPDLPVMGGGNVVVAHNIVIGNDTPNFAPPGNIVASVPRGTGVMVMANDWVRVLANRFADNPTAHVMVLSYPNAFTDVRYNPVPRGVTVVNNEFGSGGYDPQVPGAAQLVAAFGGALPPVLWDGLGEPPRAMGEGNAKAWTLGLPALAAPMTSARPAPFTLPDVLPTPAWQWPGAPEAVLNRIGR